jgi:signal transduction histidine kinase
MLTRAHAQGWSLKCEKGGIRRVLMNVFGNSLKFTTVRRLTVLAIFFFAGAEMCCV